MGKIIPDISVVIVNYKTEKLTKACIDSVIDNTAGIEYEIIVVDNASNDKSVKMLENMADRNKIRLIKSEVNKGFAAGNNMGIAKALGKYILLLNSDTLVTSNVLKNMFEWLEMKENRDVGIVSCALKGKDNRYQFPGGYFPTLLRVFSWMTIEDLPLVTKFIKPFHLKRVDLSKAHELDWVTGAFFMIRKSVINEVGPLDDDYFMYTEEVDYCYRAKKNGWKIVYQPKWSIIHLGGASSNSEYAILQEFKGVKIFYRKHFPSWQYPFLVSLLKLGSSLRIGAFYLLGKKSLSDTYVKAFQIA